MIVLKKFLDAYGMQIAIFAAPRVGLSPNFVNQPAKK
jgi:hypothetical protein